jgi:hypothetical protein
MPDFFGCPPWLFERKRGYRTQTAELMNLWEENGMNFGSVPWVIRDGLDVICETKLTFGTSGLADLLDYLARIGAERYEAEEVRGIYLWKTGFMLVVVINGLVTEITESLWKTSGSRELLSNFLRRKKCNWRLGLEKMCTTIGASLHPTEAFLGRGGFGFVFKVFYQGEVCALKMALELPEDGDRLRMEAEVIASYCTIEPARKHIVTLHSEAVHSVLVGPVVVVGYLMSSVGSAAPNRSAKDRYDIFMSLVNLHLLKIVHGDARLANVILVDTSLRWIDFMNSHITYSRTEFKNDAVALVKPMYGSGKSDFSLSITPRQTMPRRQHCTISTSPLLCH